MTFTDLGTGLFRLQGGVVQLRGYGCSDCGHGFWLEDDGQRRPNPSDTLCCPRCRTERLSRPPDSDRIPYGALQGDLSPRELK